MSISTYHCFSRVLDVTNVGRTSSKWPFLCQIGYITLTLTINSATEVWYSLPQALRMCTSPVISRPTISSRSSSNPLNAFLLPPQIRLLLITVRIYKLYLFTHLLTLVCRNSASKTYASDWREMKKLATKPRLLNSWSVMNRMRMPPSRVNLRCWLVPQNRCK